MSIRTFLLTIILISNLSALDVDVHEVTVSRGANLTIFTMQGSFICEKAGVWKFISPEMNYVEIEIDKEDEDRIKRLCAEAINNFVIPIKSTGGPNFEVTSITYGNTTSFTVMFGTIDGSWTKEVGELREILFSNVPK